ncbi:CLUMA_CG004193, isoform A [Clunio marinus]|uniref:CLUMA_CG004193, isoform A n=1 Tax=Clunio marinus TaxID=568069 RepID=A0A1J1HR01_9DIPT|nr:CLUMA_CG004193, isoform A [Clunio marinus]
MESSKKRKSSPQEVAQGAIKSKMKKSRRSRRRKPSTTTPNNVLPPNDINQSGSDSDSCDVLSSFQNQTNIPHPKIQQQQQVKNQQQKGKQSEEKVKKTKPIIVESNYDVINNLINAMQLQSSTYMKLLSGRRVQILCANSDEKKKIIVELKNKQIRFHSFTEAEDKPVMFVLLGHYYIELDSMKEKLVQSGLQPTNVTFLNSNKENPLYLVHFVKASIDLPTLTHKYKFIGNLIVRWQLLDHNRKKHTQCRRCQQWGHSASNCGYEYRCVKCVKVHNPGECERTTRDNTTENSVQCVNCSEHHPANSTKCKAFVDYVTRINSRQRKNNLSTSNNVENVINDEEFQTLPSGKVATQRNVQNHLRNNEQTQQRNNVQIQQRSKLKKSSYAEAVMSSQLQSIRDQNESDDNFIDDEQQSQVSFILNPKNVNSKEKISQDIGNTMDALNKMLKEMINQFSKTLTLLSSQLVKFINHD